MHLFFNKFLFQRPVSLRRFALSFLFLRLAPDLLLLEELVLLLKSVKVSLAILMVPPMWGTVGLVLSSLWIVSSPSDFLWILVMGRIPSQSFWPYGDSCSLQSIKTLCPFRSEETLKSSSIGL